MTYDLVWEFEVATDNRAAFEEAYGPQGDWARLFEGAPGFIEVILLNCSEDPHRYMTIDRWASAWAFEEFKREFATEYDALGQRLEAVTSNETRIGAFERLD